MFSKIYQTSKTCLTIVFQNNFLFSRTKEKLKNMFDNQKFVFYFFVLKNKKIKYFHTTFLVVFIYFLKIVLKNNYTNMYYNKNIYIFSHFKIFYFHILI